ncbi:hypothetical protein FBQ82_21950 [Anaerolineae bacterium CFX7]|nr:hypothetical protein [Anaerolineae bacterium CFX7]
MNRDTMKKFLRVCFLICIGFLLACRGAETPMPTALTATTAPTLNITAQFAATAAPTGNITEQFTATIAPAETQTITPLPRATNTTTIPAATIAPTLAKTPTIPAPATRTTLTGSAREFTRLMIDAEKHPKAKCNDGTTPLFFLQRGKDDGADKWVLYFKGGGACSSKTACEQRERGLTSATPWLARNPGLRGADEEGIDGILSDNPAHNPDFYNWNHVFMVYCSSDLWAGTRAASDESFGWYCAGHYIADAFMDALADEAIVGAQNLAQAKQILVTGSSAGGFGVHNNIDRMAERFHDADVRAVSDAAVANFASVATTGELGGGRQEQWNLWQPRYDESCMTANADAPWICRDGDFLASQNHITTPMFIHADQLDPVLAGAMGLDPRKRDDRARMLENAAGLRALLQNEPAAFSPFNGKHVGLTNERFYGYKINGLTLFQVLGNWYFQRSGPVNVIEAPRPLR